MSVATINLEIVQGATFSKDMFWFGGGKVCRLIENLEPGCPTRVTITAHGLPSSISMPVFVSHVEGAKRANTKNEPVTATYIDADTFFLDVDTVGQTYEAGTGLVTYYSPKDLTGYSARMQVRETREDTDTLLDLVSPTNITITAPDGKITIDIDDTTTTALDFDEAVYDLELEDGSGVVTRLVEGSVTLRKEVTR